MRRPGVWGARALTLPQTMRALPGHATPRGGPLALRATKPTSAPLAARSPDEGQPLAAPRDADRTALATTSNRSPAGLATTQPNPPRIPGLRFLGTVLPRQDRNPDPTALHAIADRYYSQGADLPSLLDPEGLLRGTRDPSRDLEVLMRGAGVDAAAAELRDGPCAVFRSLAYVQEILTRASEYEPWPASPHLRLHLWAGSEAAGAASLSQGYLQGGLPRVCLGALFEGAGEAAWSLCASLGRPVDVQGWAEDAALMILAKALLGTDADGWVRGDGARHPGLGNAWRRVLSAPNSLSSDITTEKAEEALQAWVFDVIEERLRGGVPDRRAHPDMLSHMLRERNRSGDSVALRTVAEEAISVVVAAGGVLSQTVAWTLLMMAERPQRIDKAAGEARRAVQSLRGSPLSRDALSRLPFLTCCVLETLRLHPPARAVPMMCKRGALIGPYKVPPHTLCLPSTHLLHRHEAAWPRPHEWLPERWFAERAKDLGVRDDRAYVPFGKHPGRVLAGQQVAMPAARAVLAEVLAREVEVVTVAGFQPRTAGLLSSRSATGVVLRVARRRDELSAGADDGGWGMDFTLGGVAQPPAHLRGVQMAT